MVLVAQILCRSCSILRIRFSFFTFSMATQVMVIITGAQVEDEDDGRFIVMATNVTNKLFLHAQ